jgi:ADP-ribosylation factor-like protein 3
MALRTLRSRAKKDNETRILILGLDNAGKTTILNRLGGLETGNETTTQSFNMRKVNYRDTVLNMCDVGGQRKLREFWKDYFNTDCLIFVVDSCDQRRMEESRLTFDDVVEGLPTVPILVFANKQDLASAATPASVAENLNLHMTKDRPWHIQGCSAKNGDGVNEGIDWILSARGANAAAPPAA